MAGLVADEALEIVMNGTQSGVRKKASRFISIMRPGRGVRDGAAVRGLNLGVADASLVRLRLSGSCSENLHSRNNQQGLGSGGTRRRAIERSTVKSKGF